MDPFKTPLKSKSYANIIKIPPSPQMKKIGFGTGVAVYELQRSPIFGNIRSPWAVKKLTQRHKKDGTLKFLDERLQAEADFLRRLNHPNIIGFRAFLKNSDGSSVLAMEECTSCLGDMIENRLEKLGVIPYQPKTILKVSYDIAKALDYLHNKVLLLHGDVKSFNILVNGDFSICKLCDFGVCLPLTKSGIIDKEKAEEEAEYTGTPCWCAPEVLKFPQEISTKADIYAYGLVIWEMMALSPPIDEGILNNFNNSLESEESNEISVAKGIVRQRPCLPDDVELSDEYNLILEIYFCCTSEDMMDRPDAEDLKNLLDGIFGK